MKTESTQEPKESAIATTCTVIGVLSLLIGIAMLAFAFANINGSTSDTGSFIIIAFSVCLSSIGWLGFGKIIALLVGIEWNTRDQCATAKTPVAGSVRPPVSDKVSV